MSGPVGVRDDMFVEAANVRNAGLYYRLGVFRYATIQQISSTAVHMKTNVAMSSNMIMFEAKGYEYGASKVIDARIACYPYAQSGTIFNVGTDGTHTMSAYKSADGFLCFRLPLTSSYYVGFVCNVFEANPPGISPLEVTASQLSPAETVF